MVKKCCVKCCKSESFSGCGISFHKFPTKQEMKEKWTGVTSQTITKNSVVCSLHFKSEDFYEANSRRLLNSNAVPSIFPPPEKPILSKINIGIKCEPTGNPTVTQETIIEPSSPNPPMKTFVPVGKVAAVQTGSGPPEDIEKREIREDTQNYIQYETMKMHGEKVILRLKKGVVPHKFDCQRMDKPVQKVERVSAQRSLVPQQVANERQPGSKNSSQMQVLTPLSQYVSLYSLASENEGKEKPGCEGLKQGDRQADKDLSEDTSCEESSVRNVQQLNQNREKCTTGTVYIEDIKPDESETDSADTDVDDQVDQEPSSPRDPLNRRSSHHRMLNKPPASSYQILRTEPVHTPDEITQEIYERLRHEIENALIGKVYQYLLKEYIRFKTFGRCDISALSDVVGRTAAATGAIREHVVRVVHTHSAEELVVPANETIVKLDHDYSGKRSTKRSRQISSVSKRKMTRKKRNASQGRQMKISKRRNQRQAVCNRAMMTRSTTKTNLNETELEDEVEDEHGIELETSTLVLKCEVAEEEDFSKKHDRNDVEGNLTYHTEVQIKRIKTEPMDEDDLLSVSSPGNTHGADISHDAVKTEPFAVGSSTSGAHTHTHPSEDQGTDISHQAMKTEPLTVDFELSQHGDQTRTQLNKTPKTSAERGRDFRTRQAMLKLQNKQQEPETITEIAIQDDQSPGPSEISSIDKRARSAEATRRWRQKKRGVCEPLKRQAKTAAQRMREYRQRKKI